MGGNSAFGLGVAVLALGVLLVIWLAVAFVLRSRMHARRPWLPFEDRPPANLSALRSSDIAREVDAGLATLSGYLRRRTLHG